LPHILLLREEKSVGGGPSVDWIRNNYLHAKGHRRNGVGFRRSKRVARTSASKKQNLKHRENGSQKGQSTSLIKGDNHKGRSREIVVRMPA